MRTLLAFLSFLNLFSISVWSQSPIDTLLREYNKRSIPYISVDELNNNLNKYLILDTRKKEEYEVSHLPGAIWVGEQLNEANFKQEYPDTTKAIVVYCSVGIRSEDFGESLKNKGYTQVKNLYGSIFAWKDKGYDVLNNKEKVTDSVHVFNEIWGAYLKKGIKIH